MRFCYQRRRVGWPELYDEMCAVATRGLFRGMGHDALAEIGVGFSLFETPRLAALVARIVSEEQAARRAARVVALEAARRRGREGGPEGWRQPPIARRPAGPAAPRAGGQARMRLRAISPSIWRSAST